MRNGTRERGFGATGVQGWFHPGLDPWVQGSEDGGAPAPGSAQAKEGLQLSQVQLQFVGWGTVPKVMRWGRVQGPVWLYNEALVLLQGQGL